MMYKTRKVVSVLFCMIFAFSYFGKVNLNVAAEEIDEHGEITETLETDDFLPENDYINDYEEYPNDLNYQEYDMYDDLIDSGEFEDSIEQEYITDDLSELQDEAVEIEDDFTEIEYIYEAGSMTKCTRDDGVWLFPLDSKWWNNFSDYAGCAGKGACLICGLKHDGSHSYTVGGKTYKDNWGCATFHNLGVSGQYPNMGVDMGADNGSNVYAARSGKIYFNTSTGNNGRGRYVIIEHPINDSYSYYSLYQHLSKLNNGIHKNGSDVKTGDVIGEVGNSHLHFEVFIGPKGGGQACANNVDNATNYYTNAVKNGYLKTVGITKGAIITNPKNTNNPSGQYGVGGPCGSVTWEYHKGSITYTFDKTKVPSSSGIQSTLKIENHNSVAAFTSGGNYTPNGVVKSNYALNYVNAYILKSDGSTIVNAGYSHQLSNTYSYTLKNSAIMNELKFNSLTAGTYYFKVTSQDSSGTAKNLVYEKFEVKPKNNSPKGWVDVIESTSTNKIHIRGWAYDPDINSKSLVIHIYVGGSAGTGAPVYAINANKERKDVNKVYGCGDYHGFDETITVNKTGNVSVYVYALDGNGINDNPMIGSKTITMHTHTFDSGVVTKTATCANDGIKTYTCKTCGEKKTENIAKLGHQIVNDTDKRPTCISTGLTEGSHCSRCGTVIKKQNTINATGHDWGEWKITTPATEYNDGIETRVCKNDISHIETRIIPKLEKKESEEVLHQNNSNQEIPYEGIEPAGNDNINENIYSKGKISTTGIYCAQTYPSIIAGMVTEKTNSSDNVEYRWLECEENEGIWTEISPWTQNNEWLDWKPAKSGNYIFVCQARVVGNEDASLISESFGTTYTKNDGIMDICQMPYWGEGGGYLIGFESFDNPNLEYKYEMFVMDLSLFSSGAPIPWVYRTGAITLAEGKTLWTIWQPEYGYYLTLFRLYDKDGKIVDEVCYGFANVY